MNDSLYQQETDIAVVLMLAAHCERRTFIDVGAEKGEFARNLMGLGWSGDLFEPFPNHLAALRGLVAGSGSRVFDLAIDETDHEGLLHIAFAADGTTMDYFHSLHRDEAHPLATHAQALPVHCRSLGSLAGEGVTESEVGILKIDTEGNDLKVINGMGHMKADVLMCEFVTPKLYPTWENSFPEALVRAARQRGYEKCIAVKRFGSFEVIDFDPAGFVDGQWGNLIFTSHALLEPAGEKLRDLALCAEKKLVTALAEGHRSLEEKEQVIHTLNEACIERLAKIEELRAKIEKQSAKEEKQRTRIEELQNKISILRTKS